MSLPLGPSVVPDHRYGRETMDGLSGEPPPPVVPAYHDACVTALVPALLEGPEGPDGCT